MPPAGFKPTISAGERPQTYGLDRAATGTGSQLPLRSQIITFSTETLVNEPVKMQYRFNIKWLCDPMESSGLHLSCSRSAIY